MSFSLLNNINTDNNIGEFEYIKPLNTAPAMTTNTTTNLYVSTIDPIKASKSLLMNPLGMSFTGMYNESNISSMLQPNEPTTTTTTMNEPTTTMTTMNEPVPYLSTSSIANNAAPIFMTTNLPMETTTTNLPIETTTTNLPIETTTNVTAAEPISIATSAAPAFTSTSGVTPIEALLMNKELTPVDIVNNIPVSGLSVTTQALLPSSTIPVGPVMNSETTSPLITTSSMITSTEPTSTFTALTSTIPTSIMTTPNETTPNMTTSTMTTPNETTTSMSKSNEAATTTTSSNIVSDPSPNLVEKFSNNSGLPWFVYLLICIGVFFVIVLIILAIYSLKRKYWPATKRS